MMKRVLGSTVAMLICVMSAGCGSGDTPPAKYVENTRSHYHFTHVDQQAERERVYQIVKSHAVPDSLEPKEVPTTPDFDLRFVVARLSAIDEMHGKIVFVRGQSEKDSVQLFNSRDPAFSITYDTLSIGGGIEVIVRFNVTPGAKLFYKPQGGPLSDITKQVDGSGRVSFTTRLAEGQRYFFARAISGGVSKWLKINVFTQQVQEISEREFEDAK